MLILLMLIIIPLLNINDPDVSLSLGAQLVHKLTQLNDTDPHTYQSGLLLAIQTVKDKLPVVEIILSGGMQYYIDQSLSDSLRPEEKVSYQLSSNGTTTMITFDQKHNSIISAQYSIYTTAFIVVLLVSGIYAFSVDVQNLVITPIEKLVKLVKKIAENPLGVEYKMLGEDEGFKEGMETTILLTTITKIGGLMRVGFGEAGAAIIARNLQESSGGKLNLLGAGRTIYSIFGFCDVRQFTDTTECLQEEVMLFVNRIAHILHSIVVQCSGAANKNIGDAFLLTWKLNDKGTAAEKARVADQALLTFVKALVELSRHQEFICNFSVAATSRLLKRFPDYKVRIGSGLHVGMAVEGAIGSNRKIDATYISPHVSNTEFLESSTKEYGVSLLLSEPFYNLLSSSAQRFIRQVDRVKKSANEAPFGLYTYDVDLSIDWNDKHRHRKQSDLKTRLINAARRTSVVSNEEKSNLLAPINEHSGSFSVTTTTNPNAAASDGGRRKSKDIIHAHLPQGRQSSVQVTAAPRRGSVMSQFVSPLGGETLEEVDEENPEQAEEDAADKIEKAKQTPTITVEPYTERVWVEDQDVVDARHLISDAFRGVWAEGMDAFIIGDWARAQEKFAETFRLSKKRDGPSKRILAYMEDHHNVAPDNWHGYNDLTEGSGGH
jgi:class 3 adenylate cyclase